MSEDILVLAEQRDGVLNRSTWEAVVAGQKIAKELGKEVTVLILGKDLNPVAEQVAETDVKEVLIADDEKLSEYTPDGYSAAIKQVIEKEKPHYVLFTHTYMVRDFVPKLAAALERALISDCTRYKMGDGKLVFVRQVFQGKIDADISFEGEPPYLVTFQVGAFNADDLESGSGKASIRNAEIDMAGVEIRTKVLEIFEGVKQEVDLSKAERIVSVGRGIKKEENLEIVKQLAEEPPDPFATRGGCL
ncbi:MAG: electron transfer flavoprotein subunit alpha/FixB family protein [bacterium]